MSSRQPYKFSGRYVYDDIVLPFGESRRPTVDKIKAGDIPSSDVIITTFPRCGTSRLLEITWQLLMRQYYPDNHKEITESMDIVGRFIFIEESDADMKLFEREKPVIVKSHLPYSLLKKVVEQNKRVIVGTRNFKDCLVSLYHFYKIAVPLDCFKGSWEEFFEMFQAGDIIYGNCIDWTCDWWKQKDRDNILLVSFEDLSRTPCIVIKEMANFLGIQNITEKEIEEIAKSVDFEKMKSNPKTNYSSRAGTRYKGSYLRKGAVGDWKNYFSQDENAYIDKLFEEKCLPIGLKMNFE